MIYALMAYRVDVSPETGDLVPVTAVLDENEDLDWVIDSLAYAYAWATPDGDRQPLARTHYVIHDEHGHVHAVAYYDLDFELVIRRLKR